jgi:hypothetical protein
MGKKGTGGSKPKFWIQKATAHMKKGALTRYAKKHHESTKAAVRQGMHSKSALIKKRANFANNMRKIAAARGHPWKTVR